MIVLKRLEQALADGDHIEAVILGSGVNQDGRTNGITAPSPQSQANLEREVYQRAGVDPSTITYVETHGTGTRLVGPVAVKSGLSVREAFAAEVRQTQPMIEPLDVAAIEARLADADRTMTAMRATTDDDIARLRRLTPR